jgi:hypothetical protein
MDGVYASAGVLADTELAAVIEAADALIEAQFRRPSRRSSSSG